MALYFHFFLMMLSVAGFTLTFYAVDSLVGGLVKVCKGHRSKVFELID